MKTKIITFIKIFSIVSLLFLLSACFGKSDNDDIEKAKKEMGVVESTGLVDSEDEGGSIEEESSSEEEQDKQVIINKITDNQLVELDDLSSEDFIDGEFELKGSTLGKVDKIVVTFENSDSEFPKDEFVLKQFKPGDKTFVYRAFSRYETFDFGKNVYLIEAYSGDEVSKTELIVNYVSKEESEQSNNDKTDEKIDDEISQNIKEISINDLPKNSSFGNPTKLGSGKIGYSDIKGLEIKNTTINDLTCENLTDVYKENIGGYFYWNTCRPLGNDNGISFYVIRLVGDKYYYEKHYYLSNKSIYGVQELETGEGVTRETLEAKNDELKFKNPDYPIIKISDSLFNELMK